MEIAPGTRASDAERDKVVKLLSRHLADGRIDLVEYDQRVARVYGTATRDDLQLVLSDLPKLSKEAQTQGKLPARLPIWQQIEGTSWLGVSILVLAIWGAISLSVGEFTYPWPIWVIGPWGAVLAFRVLAGFESGRFGHRAG
ncbi:DUF1707 domain-containing protein [Nocardia sp. GCM10030253]|uniref:DUF1707 SHOCT-like domain-containing protein n=1 Tax=Nocardia sp. GCM10030253 TaxID=3273404 RepID=UPI003636FB42